MKADGLRAETPLDRRRQHVLPSMLLHVVESARPVDGTMDRLSLREPLLAFDHVLQRSVLILDDVDDEDRVEDASVERLTARGGIKGGSVQLNDRAAVALANSFDRRVEFAAVRVVVIDP